jgi:hypothetical protein
MAGLRKGCHVTVFNTQKCILLYIVEDGLSEDWWADVTQNAIRKTKSAENIGRNPTIIVHR